MVDAEVAARERELAALTKLGLPAKSGLGQVGIAIPMFIFGGWIVRDGPSGAVALITVCALNVLATLGLGIYRMRTERRLLEAPESSAGDAEQRKKALDAAIEVRRSGPVGRGYVHLALVMVAILVLGGLFHAAMAINAWLGGVIVVIWFALLSAVYWRAYRNSTTATKLLADHDARMKAAP